MEETAKPPGTTPLERQYALIVWLRGERICFEQDLRDLAAWVGLVFEPRATMKQIAQSVYGRLAKLSKVKKGLSPSPRVLLVVDGAYWERSLQELLPQPSQSFDGCFHWLLTTRQQDVWEKYFGVQYSNCPLGVFTKEESLSYLRAALEMAVREKADYSDVSLIKLSKLLGYLPLGLLQAVAYLNKHSGDREVGISSYCDQFEKNFLKLANTSTHDYYEQTLLTTWLISLPKLFEENPQAIELLLCCAYLSGEGIPTGLLRAYWGDIENNDSTIAEDVRQQMAILVNYSLAEYLFASSTNDQRLGLRQHQLLQTVVKHWGSGELLSSRNKVLRELLEKMDRELLQASPSVNRSEILFKVGSALNEYAKEKYDSFEDFNRRCGLRSHFPGILEVMENTKGVDLGKKSRLCIDLRWLAIRVYPFAASINVLIESFDKISQHAKSAYFEDDSRIQESQLNTEVVKSMLTGNAQQTLLLKERLLDVRETAYGIESRQYAHGLLEVASAYLSLSQTSSAISCVQKAVEILEPKLGDKLCDKEFLQACQLQARCYAQKREWMLAEESITKAILYIEKIASGAQNYSLTTCELLITLADSYLDSMQYDKANEAYSQIEEKMQDSYSNAVMRSSVYLSHACCYYHLQRYGEAIGKFNEAIRICELMEITDMGELMLLAYSGALFQLGSIYNTMSAQPRLFIPEGNVAGLVNNCLKAKECFEKAIKLIERHQSTYFLNFLKVPYLKSLSSLYEIYIRMGEDVGVLKSKIIEVIAHYKNAPTAKSIEYFGALALPLLCSEIEQFDDEMFFYREMLLLAETTCGNPNDLSIAKIIGNIPFVNTPPNHIEEKLTWFKRGLEILRKNNNPIFSISQKIGHIYKRQNRLKEAMLYFAEDFFSYHTNDSFDAKSFFFSCLLCAESHMNVFEQIKHEYLLHLAVYALLQARRLRELYKLIEEGVLEDQRRGMLRLSELWKKIDGDNQALSQAVDAVSSCPRGWYSHNLGNFCLSIQDVETAIFWYERTIALEEEDPCYHNLACCYAVIGEYDKADVYFQVGIGLFPTSGILAEYAQFLIKQGRYEESLSYIDRCLQEPIDGLLDYGNCECCTVIQPIQELISKSGSQRIQLSAHELARYLQVFCYQICEKGECIESAHNLTIASQPIPVSALLDEEKTPKKATIGLDYLPNFIKQDSHQIPSLPDCENSVLNREDSLFSPSILAGKEAATTFSNTDKLISTKSILGGKGCCHYVYLDYSLQSSCQVIIQEEYGIKSPFYRTETYAPGNECLPMQIGFSTREAALQLATKLEENVIAFKRKEQPQASRQLSPISPFWKAERQKAEQLQNKELMSNLITDEEVAFFCQEKCIEGFSATVRDGNCFFHAVLAGLPNYHRFKQMEEGRLELRKQAVNYMRYNPEKFPPSSVENESLEEYLTRMARSTVWAEGPIIAATALLLNITISVIELGKENNEITTNGNFTACEEVENEEGTILLIRVNQNHYHLGMPLQLDVYPEIGLRA